MDVAFTVCVLVLFGAAATAIAGLVRGWLRPSDCYAWMAVFCGSGALLGFVAGSPFMGALLAVLAAGYVALWWKHRRRGGSPLPAFRGGR